MLKRLNTKPFHNFNANSFHHILEEYDEFTLTLQDTTVRESEDAVMVVEITKESEEVRWYKDGKEIIPDPSQRYQVESMGRQHKLVIRSASLDDMGIYSCTVEERECSAQLHVAGGQLLSLIWHAS